MDSCVSSGVQVDRLLSGLRLNKSELRDSRGRTSFDDVARLWEESFRATGNRAFGLETSNFLPFGAIRIVDFVIVASETPECGISKFVSYYPLINGAFRLNLVVERDFTSLELHNEIDPEKLPVQYVECPGIGCRDDGLRRSRTFWVHR